MIPFAWGVAGASGGGTARRRGGDEGLEHAAKAPEKRRNQAPGGTESGTPNGSAFPADLALVVDRWAALPSAVRAGILAIVQANTGE